MQGSKNDPHARWIMRSYRAPTQLLDTLPKMVPNYTKSTLPPTSVSDTGTHRTLIIDQRFNVPRFDTLLSLYLNAGRPSSLLRLQIAHVR